MRREEYWFAEFERPDGSTFVQPYIHVQELARLVVEYRASNIWLVDIY